MNLTRRRTAATLAALMVVLPAPAVAHAAVELPLFGQGAARMVGAVMAVMHLRTS
ncbi:hypothetical protein SAMN04489765_4308 [Tsukamurella pulmonis]|uniref:Uncharacterized protein n=1 Tax=Tsukamurella pulmonis TaxID=47312 RepID=A0A1H1HLF6_9ACTN|nr:hypothetical protein [Tsukamurella pulmonis]SDR25948.1 hypothetical protein SAMN04489765_4308 [Tsukamurella pulmonis]SUP14212.1 Uncharacterised protein [Tsukamurella pulmonis]